MQRLLIANRGEVAVRVVRAAHDLGLEAIALHALDESGALHVRLADRAETLPGAGPAAYLDIDAVIAAAKAAGADAIHPGWGFLSERADFAGRCDAEGITFVGPAAKVLAVFGDKAHARRLAMDTGVPVLPGTSAATSLAEMQEFMRGQSGAAVIVKAIAGGGGRGMRVVHELDDLPAAFERCSSEAGAAFGDESLYVERLLERARHLEVQVIGDGASVRSLGTRECSLQRRHQKLVEIAPAIGIPDAVVGLADEAACALAAAVALDSLTTVEFLVGADGTLAFMEANARLQVEHTVTEQVTGLDLVSMQLRIAAGASLSEFGLERPVEMRGVAIQVRVNTETMSVEGDTIPQAGTLDDFQVPTGPGVRVDTLGYRGLTTSSRYDSLLAKIIVHHPSGHFADARARSRRALDELVIEGVATNKSFLLRVLDHPDVLAESWDIGWIDRNVATLAAGLDAGARRTSTVAAPAGSTAVSAPMLGTIVSIDVRVGDLVPAGGALMVLEAMKMEHVVQASFDCEIVAVNVHIGDTVAADDALLFVTDADVGSNVAHVDAVRDPDEIRPDLAVVVARHAVGTDRVRTDAVARRRKVGLRTTRENIADLVDPGSFIEYAPLAIAAQRRRRTLEDLIANTPGDGMVTGTATVNGEHFGPERGRVVVMSYDYTVLAGTQGLQNHRKTDRMFEMAERLRLPFILFGEGGGGRPGDTDGFLGMDNMTFRRFGALSGLVPLVGIAAGRSFAGHAALLGCCDVVIAAVGTTIGMGGPAMIEGGGLGVFTPEEVGPLDVQFPNGVVDVVVADEAEGVRVAKQYLSYFQGPVTDWTSADQRALRHVIPEQRLRAYDVHTVIDGMFDTGSVLELRSAFGVGMVTALARLEGRPVGVIANNPNHLAGAITSDGADKAARFMQLCDAFDLPIVFLCDTPGIMVGPEAEKTALVRHASRLFVLGASVTVPTFTIVLRKAYGLGAMAMSGGSFKATEFTVAWPTGEFGPMGLEGSVRLGYKKELEAIDDLDERKRRFDTMVEALYEEGKAINSATQFEIDDVIDPADSRRWLSAGLAAAGTPAPRQDKKRPCVDTW